MTDRTELLKRINGFMDDLSDEAKSSFGEDLDGIIDYASVGTFDSFSEPNSGPSVWEVESKFSESLRLAISDKFSSILVSPDWVIPTLLPLDENRIQLFSSWVDRYHVEEVRVLAEANDDPVAYSEDLLADCVRQVILPKVPQEAGSKAEMKFAGTLPQGLTIDNLRAILEILPHCSQLRLAMSSLPEAEEGLILDEASYANVTLLILQTVKTISSEPALRWFLAAVVARLNAPECLVYTAMSVRTHTSSRFIYNLLIDLSLQIFEHDISEIEAGADDLSASLQRRLRSCAVLGRALFVYADLSESKEWTLRSNNARSRLCNKMETRLNKCQPLISDFLLSTDISKITQADKDLADQALFAMAEFSAIAELPQVFALASFVQQYSKRYAKMFEVGLERMLDSVKMVDEADRVHLVERFEAVLKMADLFFNDSYPALMRSRLSNELTLLKA